MACGVPCVVTDVGDSALIVGSIGSVVLPSMPDALCEGFRLVMKRLGPSISEAARTSIVNRFSYNVLVTDTVEVLSEL